MRQAQKLKARSGAHRPRVRPPADIKTRTRYSFFYRLIRHYLLSAVHNPPETRAAAGADVVSWHGEREGTDRLGRGGECLACGRLRLPDGAAGMGYAGGLAGSLPRWRPHDHRPSEPGRTAAPAQRPRGWRRARRL